MGTPDDLFGRSIDLDLPHHDDSGRAWEGMAMLDIPALLDMDINGICNFGPKYELDSGSFAPLLVCPDNHSSRATIQPNELDNCDSYKVD